MQISSTAPGSRVHTGMEWLVRQYRAPDPSSRAQADFGEYINGILHEWSKTLTAFAFTLVPIFFLLDYFTMPKALLPRFGMYRLVSTVLALAQHFVIRQTPPGRMSIMHGYLASFNVGGTITLMTVDLGGFDSAYYAGLNLVLIGANLLLPWPAVHTALNSLMIISLYLAANLLSGLPFKSAILINNLFFLCATAILAVSINYIKYRLIKQEFSLRVELQEARDSLWSEMELAKRIQTALLPDRPRTRGYQMAASMLPAQEVGGDYYDVIETPSGECWVAMGDVSGHGVDSGLIMMMAQTSIASLIHRSPRAAPSQLLAQVNAVLRENILRLGSDHYMTMVLIRCEPDRLVFAGKHQDILIYRAGLNHTEPVPTGGTWLGITDDIAGHVTDAAVEVHPGDVVLLFTDGIPEAMNANGEMFGQERLENALGQYANLPAEKILEKVFEEVRAYQAEQADDITLVVLKRE